MDNPITQLSDYRLKIIASLPQLQKLDSDEITDEERSIANQKYPTFKDIISNPVNESNYVSNQIHSSPGKVIQPANDKVPSRSYYSNNNQENYENDYESPQKLHNIESRLSTQPQNQPQQRSQWGQPLEVKLGQAHDLQDNETYIYDQSEQKGEIHRLKGTVENLQLQLQVQQEKQQLVEEKLRLQHQKENGIFEAALILVRNMNQTQLSALRQEIDRLSSV